MVSAINARKSAPRSSRVPDREKPAGPAQGKIVSMHTKDFVLSAGTLVTLALGLWNFVEARNAAKRLRFINTVTSQRILWIEQLRQDMAKFVGLAGVMAFSDDKGDTREVENKHELNRLRQVLLLRLNTSAPLDREISALLTEIFKEAYAHSYKPDVEIQLDYLIERSQRMLKDEWEKVKREAENGHVD